MNYPYMPKSTALWLIENTALTFEQIADFCGLHELEVKNIADAETYKIQPLNPILSGQLTRDDIKKCEEDANARLTLRKEIVDAQQKQNKKDNRMTVRLSYFYIYSMLQLSKCVNSLSESGYLSSSCVLMEDSLSSSLVDSNNSFC